jgi:hypothetical protein
MAVSTLPEHDELERLSDEELIARYNAHASHTTVGTGFYREELARRKQERQNERVLALTKTIRNLTVILTMLTILNAVLVAVTVFKD